MNNHTFPSRPELKLRARTQMGQTFGACSALGFAVAIVGMLAVWFQQKAGGAFLLYYWETASSDIQSSVSLSLEGLFAALRLEEAGVGLSVVITPAVLGTFLLVRLVTTAVIAPFRVGCMDNLWHLHRGEARPFRAVFGWYSHARRVGQAIALEVILWLVQTVLQGLLFLPALLVLARSGGSLTGFAAAIWLLAIAQAVVWCAMTQLMPARYLLARDSGKGVKAAFAGAWALLRRRHGQYLVFRLSFVLWELLNNATRGMMNLYLYPYQGLANMEWLEACAGTRQPGDQTDNAKMA